MLSSNTTTPTSPNNQNSSFLDDPSLKAAIYDMVYFSIMIGLGETYLSTFGIYLKGTSFQLGLLATVPQLIGAISQIIGLHLFEYGVPRKQIILFGASLQGVIWALLASIPLLFPHVHTTVWVLIGCTVLYQCFNGLAAPSWNSLIGDIVPSKIRGEFFGLRNQRGGIFTVLSMFYAGLILYSFKAAGKEWLAFFSLFLIACIARLASTHWLSKYREPGYKILPSHQFTFFDFIRAMPTSNFARFVIFAALMQFSCAIAGPYYAPYMLRDLKYSYIEFTVIIAIQLIVQFLFMQHWGKIADKFGNKRILEVTAIGISFSAVIWLITSSTWFLCLAQMYSGLVWAGYNLAIANFMFDAVTPPKRARCSAYMALIIGLFTCAGAVVGGWITTLLPSDFLISQGFNTPRSIYFKVFFISGVLRLLVAVILISVFKEVREVPKIRRRDIIFRITTVRPLSGATFGVVNQIVKRRFFERKGK